MHDKQFLWSNITNKELKAVNLCSWNWMFTKFLKHILYLSHFANPVLSLRNPRLKVFFYTSSISGTKLWEYGNPILHFDKEHWDYWTVVAHQQDLPLPSYHTPDRHPALTAEAQLRLGPVHPQVSLGACSFLAHRPYKIWTGPLDLTQRAYVWSPNVCLF